MDQPTSGIKFLNIESKVQLALWLLLICVAVVLYIFKESWYAPIFVVVFYIINIPPYFVFAVKVEGNSLILREYVWQKPKIINLGEITKVLGEKSGDEIFKIVMYSSSKVLHEYKISTTYRKTNTEILNFINGVFSSKL